MTLSRTTPGTTVSTLAVGVPLLVAASGTAAAHGGSGVAGTSGGWGGMGGFGLFGGMLLWPLLLVALVALVAYGVVHGTRSDGTDAALAELRERYARGELTDEEFETRRAALLR